MSISVDISCNDAYSIVTEILKLLKDSKEKWAADLPSPLLGKEGKLCTKNSKTLSSPVDSEGWDLIKALPLLCKGNNSCTTLAKKVVNSTQKFLGPDQCGPIFCGEDGDKDYKVPLGSCDDTKNAIKHLLTTIQSVISKIPEKDQGDISPYLDMDKLCSMANILTPQEAASLVSSKLPELLAKKLNVDVNSNLILSIKSLLSKLNMVPVLQCTCPTMGQSNKPIAPTNKSSILVPKYNKMLVGFLALAVFIITLIPVVLMSIFIKKKNNKIIAVVITIVLGIILFLTLFLSNPVCILKPCPEETDTWSPISGTYEGTSQKIAGLQVSAKIEASNSQSSWQTQKIKLISLECTDDNGHCPVNNLLSKCDSNNLYLTLGPEQDYGYPLSGDCIDQMYKIKGSTGKQTVNGVWILRHDSKIYMQILVDVVIPPVDLQKYILVELKPIS